MRRLPAAIAAALVVGLAAPAPAAVEQPRPCDARCLEQRRAELDRLLKLGTPAVTVADSSKR